MVRKIIVQQFRFLDLFRIELVLIKDRFFQKRNSISMRRSIHFQSVNLSHVRKSSTAKDETATLKNVYNTFQNLQGTERRLSNNKTS